MDIRDVEVFRAGTHTDSAGRTRTYTHSDLARIAGSYDTSLHEAPAVIGHPATNAPAWGWVSRLAVAGDRLLADFRQVAPEFAQLLREGRFKKRSVSLFPDLRLRHVGFLGAAAPAVVGLRDVAFSGGESALEYSFEHAGADPHNPHSQEDEEMKTLLEKLQADVANYTSWDISWERSERPGIVKTECRGMFSYNILKLKDIIKHLLSIKESMEMSRLIICYYYIKLH